jgi:hypothetical protein
MLCVCTRAPSVRGYVTSVSLQFDFKNTRACLLILLSLFANIFQTGSRIFSLKNLENQFQLILVISPSPLILNVIYNGSIIPGGGGVVNVNHVWSKKAPQ